jgi:hypothetical protein
MMQIAREKNPAGAIVFLVQQIATPPRTPPTAQGADEFAGNLMNRSDSENPELAYRRGYQQGADEVAKALMPILDKHSPLWAKALDRFELAVARWRYCPRNRKRHIVRDQPPRLAIPRQHSIPMPHS